MLPAVVAAIVALSLALTASFFAFTAVSLALVAAFAAPDETTQVPPL